MGTGVTLSGLVGGSASEYEVTFKLKPNECVGSSLFRKPTNAKVLCQRKNLVYYEKVCSED